MRLHPLAATAAFLFLAACGGGGNGNQSQIDGNAGENPQTFKSLALFDPVPVNPNDSPAIPFPFDGLFAGSNDSTLNIPNPTSAAQPSGNPAVTAANLQDGFSTSASWFIDIVGSVPLSEVSANLVIVNSRTGTPLRAGVDFTLQPSPARDSAGIPISAQRTRVLIEPLAALAPSTTYLVALKAAAKNTSGETLLASDGFRITRSGTAVSQQSDPALANYSDAQKARLELVRSQAVRPVVEALGFAGKEDQLVLAYSVTTQSTNTVLDKLAAAATARVVQLQNTGLNTSAVGGAGAAQIFSGITQVPYYLPRPSEENPSSVVLTGFWAADAARPDTSARFLGRVPCGAFATRATLPDGTTLQPSASTTACFPVPTQRSLETIPLLVTVPRIGTKPDAGWPVVIFQHGITRNRSDALAIADSMAQAGFVVVAIDLPLHGIVSGDAAAALRQSGRERTFDVDLVNNTSRAPGADGTADPSGAHFLNLASLLTSRDNIRQAVSDLQNLRASLGNVDLTGDNVGDLDISKVRYFGHSLGAIVGTTFLASEPNIGAVTLANPGSGIGKLLDASKTFGPVVRAGLGGLGVAEGSDSYESFIRLAQTAIDSGDPINYAKRTSDAHPVHFIEVLNDATVPNDAQANAGGTSSNKDFVLITGFTSGSTPLIQALGSTIEGPITPPLASRTLRTGAKLNVAVRFGNGTHGSVLNPADGRDITVEMQRQSANFLGSNGTCLPLGGSCAE